MKMKTKLLFVALLGISCNLQAQELKLTVSNPSDRQRQEVVSTDARRVCRLLGHNGLRVFNARGVQVDYQITHDSLLLVDASVRPHETTTFILRPGKAEPMHVWVSGALYKEREDDIAWENDRCAYRVYGPALQRTGEKAYGVDVWVKNTPEIVAPERYRLNLEGVNMKKADPVKGDSLLLNSSFHVDHGYGYDPYMVGATLGCGAPAILLGDSLVMPYCYRDYEILDNGPLRFTLSLTFNPARINGQTVTEHRVMQLDKGRHLNKITVWYDGLRRPAEVAGGFVVHEKDTTTLRINAHKALYADPTDNMEGNNCQVYIGGIFPGAATRYLPLHTLTSGATGHAVGIKKVANREPFTYYVGAAWSGYDVRTMNQWQAVMDDEEANLQEPLRVEVTR